MYLSLSIAMNEIIWELATIYTASMLDNIVIVNDSSNHGSAQLLQ